jgi:uncharacterized RDD family membrane protein YckC
MDAEYKIIGGDGKEYGPASVEELRDWILEGRILPATLVWSADAGRWTRADDMPELSESIGRILAARDAGRAGPPPVPDAFMPAGPWPRLAAFLVDLMMVSALASTLWALVAPTLGVTIKPPPENFSSFEEISRFMRDQSPYLGFFQLCWFLIDVAFNGRFGATPGKLITGLRIVREDGRPLGYPRAAVRFGARLLVETLFYLGFLPVFFRRDRRGVHDLLAGTRVISLR